MNPFREIWARITKPDKQILGPRLPFWFRGRTSINEDAAMQVAAYNRGLIYISTQIAKLPWDVKDKSNNLLVDNAVGFLLNTAPNEEMNAFFFRLVMVQQAIHHGNAYAEIERDGIGQPVAIWPLESQRMELIRTDSGQLVYRYTNPTGGYIFLNPRDVFHLKNFHTKDGLVGQGIVSFGRDILGIQIAADEMASGIFHNSGIPSGVLTHPGKMSDESYARLKKSWDEQNNGSGKKSGGTSILEEGTTYAPVNTDPEALQFLQSRQFGILEIARFLGIPPTKLFDVTAATFSNVENANLEVATDTLDSWATNLESEADVKLLNNRRSGRFTDINLYAIFRGDMKTRSDYFKAMMSVSAMTPNQIRKLEGMPGYPGGDKFYIATNNFTPVDRLDEVIDADITQKTKPTSAPPSGDKPSPSASSQELEKAATSFLTKVSNE